MAYEFAPWIHPPESVAKSFASGMDIATRVQAERDRIAVEQDRLAQEAALRRQELAATQAYRQADLQERMMEAQQTAQYRTGELGMRGQELARQTASDEALAKYRAAGLGLETSQFEEKKKMDQLTFDEEKRKAAAKKDYEFAVNVLGEDPLQAWKKYMMATVDPTSFAGIAQLDREERLRQEGLKPPEIQEVPVGQSGRTVPFYKTPQGWKELDESSGAGGVLGRQLQDQNTQRLSSAVSEYTTAIFKMKEDVNVQKAIAKRAAGEPLTAQDKDLLDQLSYAQGVVDSATKQLKDIYAAHGLTYQSPYPAGGITFQPGTIKPVTEPAPAVPTTAPGVVPPSAPLTPAAPAGPFGPQAAPAGPFDVPSASAQSAPVLPPEGGAGFDVSGALSRVPVPQSTSGLINPLIAGHRFIDPIIARGAGNLLSGVTDPFMRQVERRMGIGGTNAPMQTSPGFRVPSVQIDIPGFLRATQTQWDDQTNPQDYYIPR